MVSVSITDALYGSDFTIFPGTRDLYLTEFQLNTGFTHSPFLYVFLSIPYSLPDGGYFLDLGVIHVFGDGQINVIIWAFIKCDSLT